MGELEAEYGDRVDFVIVSAEETSERKAELEQFELGSHGLVVFDGEGVKTAHLPGHSFGKEEIVVAIRTAL